MGADLAFQGLALLALIGAAIAAFQVVRLGLDTFFAGTGAGDLESLVAELGKRLRDSEDHFRQLRDDVARIDVMAGQAVQKVAAIRYNPFGDVGSDQSFAIALLDSEDNGVVISSLYAREGTRVYAKPIVKGESKHHLSNEEKEAIRRAIQHET